MWFCGTKGSSRGSYAGADLTFGPQEEQAGAGFVELAHAYCQLVEEHRFWPAAEFLRRVQEALVPLYSSGMILPDVEPATEDQVVSRLTHEDWSARFNALLEHLGPHARYWEIYDPIEPEPDDPVAGNLADDLADIYRDLRDGLDRWEHWESQGKQDALWQWRFSFQSHWGAHAVDAIRAIHWLLYEHAIEAPEDDGEAPDA